MEIVIWYILIALALALTTLYTVFIPAISLANEIRDEKIMKLTVGSGIAYLLVATVFFPMVVTIIIANRADELIQRIALGIAGRE